jgi:hypothetical protein
VLVEGLRGICVDTSNQDEPAVVAGNPFLGKFVPQVDSSPLPCRHRSRTRDRCLGVVE